MSRYDVFISYRTTDSRPPEIADFLEQNGIRCWIAPRNIPAGTPYAKAIMDGMKQSEVFMVFISKASLASDDVLNEIDNAHRLKKTLIPVFIEDVKMSDPFGYYLNKTQWVNLYDNSTTQRNSLLNTLHGILTPSAANDNPSLPPLHTVATQNHSKLSPTTDIWKNSKLQKILKWSAYTIGGFIVLFFIIGMIEGMSDTATDNGEDLIDVALPDSVEVDTVVVIESDVSYDMTDPRFRDLTWLRNRNITDEDLKGLTVSEIRLLRNAIFAMHGRKFVSKELTDYFNRFAWYSAIKDEVDPNELTEIEKNNATFLLHYEQNHTTE